MLHDAYGNQIKTDCVQTVAAIDRYAHSLITYGTDCGVIFDAVEADPECLIARGHAALLGLFMENHEGTARAGAHIEAGRTLIAKHKGTMREQIYFRAIDAAARRDVATAIRLHEEIANQWPLDLLSAKLGQLHYFNLGNSNGMRQIAEKVITAHNQTAYAWGLLAFGLEECNELDAADYAGRKAADMVVIEPWAHHAVAHVCEARGQLDKGIKWLEERTHTWEACNSFMFTHNWWHLALFYLDKGDTDEALKIYDTRLWGAAQGDQHYSQDQAGALSMLIRLSLHGIELDQRWEDVTKPIRKREVMYDQPFLTAHFAYALARSGYRAAYVDLIRGVEQHTCDGNTEMQRLWHAYALPLCRGLGAHASNDFVLAAQLLGETRPHWQALGGSHAQRDLFEQIYIDALIRSGCTTDAVPILKARAAARPGVTTHNKQLAAALLNSEYSNT